ncbi:MAG: putative esterase [Panacagrimonas sp.]|jgi:predicted esterase|nr:WG repeat-containing protein [Panacagrimonas sp.]MCC2655022.1 putative esterase [Panacagrimonas sp.]
MWMRVALLCLLVGLSTSRAQPLVEWPGYATRTGADGATLLVPDAAGAARPILVLLPFTGGAAYDLLDRWYTASLPVHAAHRGLIVVLPAAAGSAQDYASGAAWTGTLDRWTRDVAVAVDEAVARHGGDPRRVVLAGYSMGGDLAWALMQRQRDRYAGAIVMGSRATYREKGALEHLATRGFRVSYFMAASEDAARVAGAQAAQSAATRAGIAMKSSTAPGGHVPAPPLLFADALDHAFGFDARDRPVLPTTRTALGVGQDPSDGDATGEAEVEAGADDEDTDDPRRHEYRTLDVHAVLRSGGRRPLRPATTSERPASLPTCDWEPFEDERDDSGWGYRDGRGKVRVAPHFSNADEFDEEGLAQVWDDLEGGPGYLNCKGEYFDVYYEYGADEFSDDLVRFDDYVFDRDDNRVRAIGFRNRRGQIVLPAQYEYATSFCDGVAKVGRDCRVRRDDGYKEVDVQCQAWRYIDHAGRTVGRPRVDPDCGEWLQEPRFEDAPDD